MTDIVERLKVATEGSGDLDLAILAVLGRRPDYDAEGNYAPYRILPSSQRFTRALDAALTLVPAGMAADIHVGPHGKICTAVVTEPVRTDLPDGGRLTEWKQHTADFPKGAVWERSAALALCIAALLAYRSTT